MACCFSGLLVRAWCCVHAMHARQLQLQGLPGTTSTKLHMAPGFDVTHLFACHTADLTRGTSYLCRAEALGACQASIALYTERVTEDAQPLFPINSLRNQVQRSHQVKLAIRPDVICMSRHRQMVWPTAGVRPT
jgi:hypothetical protein